MSKFKKILIAGAALVSLMFISSTQAHTVALGWKVLAGGDVIFYDLHWHGNVSSTSNTGLFIDGVEHKFTGIHNDVGSYSSLDGAIFNPSYATFSGGTLTATTGSNDWFSVTVSGLTAGSHTFATTNIALTQWNIPSAGGSITVTLPPAPTTPPTNGVPDAGSTLLMLGLGMLGLIVGAKKRLRK
jgi:hypothetical protein